MSHGLDDVPLYSIGVVKRLTGLTERQIRYYDQIGLVTPQRDGNRRMYTLKELEKLREISRLLAQGYSLHEVREIWSSGEEGDQTFIEESDAETYFRKGQLGIGVGGTPKQRINSLYPIRNRAELIKLIDITKERK